MATLYEAYICISESKILTRLLPALYASCKMYCYGSFHLSRCEKAPYHCALNINMNSWSETVSVVL